jgi:hypothetical protein
VSYFNVAHRAHSLGLGHGHIMATIDRVIGLSGNYTSYASTRIRVVVFAAWNEMNVAVKHRLTGDLATVDPYVEPKDRRVLLFHVRTRF